MLSSFENNGLEEEIEGWLGRKATRTKIIFMDWERA